MSDQVKKNPTDQEVLDGSDQVAVRQAKLDVLRESGNDPFQANWEQTHASKQAVGMLGEEEELGPEVSVAGRIVAFRLMGKAAFLKLLDREGKIQAYVRRDEIGDDEYATFKKLDLGDFIGVRGPLFRTKTGEVTVRAKEYRLVTKALRPLPEKWHGLSDNDQIYRQRYLDLVVNDESRQRFQTRSRIIREIREFMWSRDFIEVETPMLQSVSGGAAARPFRTHFNALDCDFNMRIALELHLKRMLVGGFDRVFEVGRVFRNEGLSRRHNPEFTMLEFYQAYSDFNDLMDLTEDMLRKMTTEVLGSTKVVNTTKDAEGEVVSEVHYDFAEPFIRLSVFDSILQYNPEISAEQLADEAGARKIATDLHIPLKDIWGLGKVQIEIFEKTVEHLLEQPTFITMYPAEVSPLARRNDQDPHVTDRFEFFVGGREIANGFSELNDSEDQEARFKQQVAEKDAGDDEAMHFDADYIRALEYGMPPTAGEGIGIDRLVMLLMDSPSIRDVLLFPHMRPE